jgi:hypothetical protein
MNTLTHTHTHTHVHTEPLNSTRVNKFKKVFSFFKTFEIKIKWRVAKKLILSLVSEIQIELPNGSNRQKIEPSLKMSDHRTDEHQRDECVVVRGSSGA